jgi:hypothetical protein
LKRNIFAEPSGCIVEMEQQVSIPLFPWSKYLIIWVEVQTHDLPNRKGILTIKP